MKLALAIIALATLAACAGSKSRVMCVNSITGAVVPNDGCGAIIMPLWVPAPKDTK